MVPLMTKKTLIIALTDKEKMAMRNKLHNMVNEMKQGVGIPGLSDVDAELITALANSAEAQTKAPESN